MKGLFVGGVACVVMVLACGAEPAFGFRERLAVLHPNRLASDAAPVAADEVAIDATWTIGVASDDPTVRHAANDLCDFFSRSMGLAVADGTSSARRIVLAIDPTLAKLQSKVDVSEQGIRITGVTARETYQGCCRLEDELGRRGRPAVRRGVRTFTRMFSPRMTHSGWEVEKFPDVYLDQLAHAGIDAILVFIKDPPDVTRNGKEDINALVTRASLRGIDVYAYAWFAVKAAKCHPLDDGAEAWYDATYGAIVKNAPGLKGIVCVGETSAFQTRDGKTAGFWWGRAEDRVPGKHNNGWWPSLDWVPWLKLVSKVTRRYNPDFEIVFWTYNWFHAPEPDRLALLEAIPTNVTVHVTFEMGDKPYLLDGVKKWNSDYSITRIGPSPVFRSEAEVCRRRGIRLTSMSNTGGRTWDSGVAPYEPCPERWIERFKALRKAQADYGLAGLMECHHYGFMPSFISEIGKAAFTRETDERVLREMLRGIAARDFGRGNVDAVMETWKDWSEAFVYHSAVGPDQCGPIRTGPSYPLVLPDEDVPPPPHPKYEYYEGKRLGNGWYYLSSRYGMSEADIVSFRPHIERELALWRRGNARLERAVAGGTATLPGGNGVQTSGRDGVPSPSAAAWRMLGIGQFFEHAAETVRNVREFKIAKTVGERLAILDREALNVRATIPLVEYDSSLGWEPTMNYVCNREMLEWKLDQLERMRHRLSPKPSIRSAAPLVATWRGNRAAAVSFTFDDGMRDQYELAFPKMKELGIRGTFFLNGGSIESQEPTRQGATRMTWEMVKEMSDAGMEMSNHGLNHANHGRNSRETIEADIASNDVLIARHTGKKPITYAYPNNAKNKEWSAAVVNPGRVGSRVRQTSFGGKHDVESGRKLFRKAKENRSWLVLMTHAVKFGYDQWRDPEMFYTLLADAAHDRDLWVGTFAEVSIYERLRNETKVAVTKTEKGWHVSVTPPPLDKALFAGTLDLVLPDGTIRPFDPFGGDFDILTFN